ncbi:hypothetical protein chiPu_0022306 [Chiloscyllium punctatum]|uniref:Uncharacterized protein n=1 Tax=Chiloscyllium punctatum TaxID=137246 RepID=A0A401RHL6_CHIPU|nr:hypothetical protein [Chiloscyllium punctatum]
MYNHYYKLSWLLFTQKPQKVAWLEETESVERYPSQKIGPHRAAYSGSQYAVVSVFNLCLLVVSLEFCRLVWPRAESCGAQCAVNS